MIINKALLKHAEDLGKTKADLILERDAALAPALRKEAAAWQNLYATLLAQHAEQSAEIAKLRKARTKLAKYEPPASAR